MVLNVRKSFNIRRPDFTIFSVVDQHQFRTTGNFSATKFSITSKDKRDLIAKISRNNGYSIEILDDEHDALVLIALTIIVHLCCRLTKDE